MSFKSHTSAMSYRNEAEEAEITPQNIIRNISFALENAQKGVHLDEEGNHDQVLDSTLLVDLSCSTL